MSTQYYCDLCTENIEFQGSRDRDYLDVVVEVQRLKIRMHICPGCIETFADLFIGKTTDRIMGTVKRRLG
jgi:hypothetical protein